jgi:hypothetical protein
MTSPQDISPYVVLRVISSHGFGAPVGSLATVKTVETSRSGDWLEYYDRRQPKYGTRLYRSHLWASDQPRCTLGTPRPVRGPRLDVNRLTVPWKRPFEIFGRKQKGG